jgi:hypothetical protein
LVPKLALAIATLVAGSRYAVTVRPNQSCDPPFGVHTGSCGNKGAAVSFVPVKTNAAPSSTLPRTLRWYSGVGERCVPAQTAEFLLWGFRHGSIFLKLAFFHSSPDRHGQRQPSVPLLFNGIRCDDLNQKVLQTPCGQLLKRAVTDCLKCRFLLDGTLQYDTRLSSAAIPLGACVLQAPWSHASC